MPDQTKSSDDLRDYHKQDDFGYFQTLFQATEPSGIELAKHNFNNKRSLKLRSELGTCTESMLVDKRSFENADNAPASMRTLLASANLEDSVAIRLSLI